MWLGTRLRHPRASQMQPLRKIPPQLPFLHRSHPGPHLIRLRMMTFTRTSNGGLPMSTSSPQGFPHELLEQSIEARRRYFETKVVAHQRLMDVYEALLYAIRYPA